MQPISPAELIARYDVFFLDIYGVLVRSDGVLPGAAGFLDRIRDAGKTAILLSNDASRSIASSWRRYSGYGLRIDPDQIITSGLLLKPHFARHNLAGAPTIVLGSADSAAYVRDAGGIPVAADDETARVLVCADDDGFPFLETLNDVVTTLFRRLEAGHHTDLLLPNPDLIYPASDRRFGITAGAMAAMLETILKLREGGDAMRFVPLGKPHPPIFEAGFARSPTKDKTRMVMIGDQIVTDVRGATDFGIDSVFLQSGVGRPDDPARFGLYPTFTMPALA